MFMKMNMQFRFLNTVFKNLQKKMTLVFPLSRNRGCSPGMLKPIRKFRLGRKGTTISTFFSSAHQHILQSAHPAISTSFFISTSAHEYISTFEFASACIKDTFDCNRIPPLRRCRFDTWDLNYIPSRIDHIQT